MIKNLIKAIHSDDTLESMKQFESIWNQKVSDALQAKRVQVGREIFGESVEEPEAELTLEDFSIEELELYMESEEYQQLDELSKKTLGSYIQKANKSSIDSGMAHGYGNAKSSEIDKFTNDNSFDRDTRENLKKQAKVDNKSQNKHWENIGKRHVGIATAVKKLTKEDVNSIELVLSEELLTEATKPSNLEAGKKYIMHDGPHKDPVRFNGWTGDDEKHSESVKYKSFKDIPGVKSLKDIEDKHDAKIKEHGMKDGYGKQHYAHLTALKKDGSDDYHFQAYVHKGKLRVGTGASHATFHDHGE